MEIAPILYTGNLQEATKRKGIAMEKRKVNVPLELYEEDLKSILYKVAADGIDLSTLLSGFIGDLVASNYCRNGSDEVDRANSYYDRCWYGMYNEDTFLHYLMGSFEIEYFLSVLEDMELYKEWIADGEDYKEELKEAEDTLNGYYEEWAKRFKDGKVPQDKETAFKSVFDWRKEYETFIDSCEPVNEE